MTGTTLMKHKRARRPLTSYAHVQKELQRERQRISNGVAYKLALMKAPEIRALKEAVRRQNNLLNHDYVRDMHGPLIDPLVELDKTDEKASGRVFAKAERLKKEWWEKAEGNTLITDFTEQ